MRRLSSIPAWALLAALVCASTALRFWAARGIPVPWIAPDEMIYGTLAQSLYREGQLTILDGPTPFYSFIYPALVGVFLAIGDLELGYTLTKGLQALVMSATAVPVYLWCRSLASRGWALAAAALTVAVPGLAYSGLVMTEVAFYPVMTVAAWATARALERPTAARQALVGAAALVAVTTRLQALVLLPVLVTAVVLKAVLDRDLRLPLRFWPTAAALATLAGSWALSQVVRSGPWTELLGGYQAAGETSYGLGDALEYIAYHLGDLILLCGLFPACAVTVLLLDALRGREPSGAVRAYLAVAAALSAWIVVQVGTFASRHVDRLAERDLLSLAPLLFVGFAVWLHRGGPRPRFAASLVAFTAALFVLNLPVKRLISEGALPDAFSLVPFYRLLVSDPDVNLEIVIFGGATVAAALFALVPRRLLLALPALLIVALSAASVEAGQYVGEQARLQQLKLVGPERRWIDRAVNGPVAYFFDGDFYWNAVWEAVFWNRKIERVYTFKGAAVPGPLPQQRVRVLPDGRLLHANGRPVEIPYIVAASAFWFVGGPVAEIQQQGIEQAGLNLWRLTPPVRLFQSTTGVRPSGEIRGGARVVAYGCGRGRWRVSITAVADVRAEIRQNRKLVKVRSRPPYRLLYLPSGKSWEGSIPARPAGRPGRSTCTLEIFASDIIYTTRFHYEPAA